LELKGCAHALLQRHGHLVLGDCLHKGKASPVCDFREALPPLPFQMLPLCLAELCSRQHLLLRLVADEVAGL